MDRIDGKLLRELREEQGLSLREFAQQIFVSKSAVQRWEQSSVRVSSELAKTIAAALGTTAEALYARSKEREAQASASEAEEEQTETGEIRSEAPEAEEATSGRKRRRPLSREKKAELIRALIGLGLSLGGLLISIIAAILTPIAGV